MHRALRLLAAGIVTIAGETAHGMDVPSRLNQPVALDRPDQMLFAEAVLIFSNEVRRAHGRAPRSGPTPVCRGRPSTTPATWRA